jgi:hypothetical protein
MKKLPLRDKKWNKEQIKCFIITLLFLCGIETNCP